jgi:hypothetical protein
MLWRLQGLLRRMYQGLLPVTDIFALDGDLGKEDAWELT